MQFSIKHLDPIKLLEIGKVFGSLTGRAQRLITKCSLHPPSAKVCQIFLSQKWNCYLCSLCCFFVFFCDTAQITAHEQDPGHLKSEDFTVPHKLLRQKYMLSSMGTCPPANVPVLSNLRSWKGSTVWFIVSRWAFTCMSETFLSCNPFLSSVFYLLSQYESSGSAKR